MRHGCAHALLPMASAASAIAMMISGRRTPRLAIPCIIPSLLWNDDQYAQATGALAPPVSTRTQAPSGPPGFAAGITRQSKTRQRNSPRSALRTRKCLTACGAPPFTADTAFQARPGGYRIRVITQSALEFFTWGTAPCKAGEAEA